MSTPLELVVAHRGEDLRWLRKVPRAFRVTVYEKGARHEGGIPLPNVGREAHTYLSHITRRYGDLADFSAFVQGHPFDHEPGMHRFLRSLAEGSATPHCFWWLGFLCDTDDSRGRRLFVPWSKNPDREELRLDEFHRELFGAPGPELYKFFGGAQFCVSRATALSRGPEFYSKALALSETFPNAAHCFERCWDRVFGEDGTAGRVPADKPTAYFKAIKRILNSEEPLVP